MLWLSLLAFIAALAGAISVCFLGADNMIEEIAEQIVKEETGLDIDLTEDSPEDHEN